MAMLNHTCSDCAFASVGSGRLLCRTERKFAGRAVQVARILLRPIRLTREKQKRFRLMEGENKYDYVDESKKNTVENSSVCI